jgi:hypothetical protein
MSLSKSKAIINAIQNSPDRNSLSPRLHALLETAFASDLITPNQEKETPLSWAGVWGHHVALRIMCKKVSQNLGPQAQPHLTAAFQDTLMADCLDKRRFRCSRILLEHGASLVNIPIGILALPYGYDHPALISLFRRYETGGRERELLFYLK